MTDQPKDTRLWCLHHIGPDDMHPAPDFATAQKWADYSNRTFDKYADISRFVVALWPWAAATHAEGLEQSIKDWTLPEQPSDAADVLSCDVRLPPATTITAGCTFDTLRLALRMPGRPRHFENRKSLPKQQAREVMMPGFGSVSAPSGGQSYGLSSTPKRSPLSAHPPVAGAAVAGEEEQDWLRGDWYEKWQDATENADDELMATLEALRGRVDRTILAALSHPAPAEHPLAAMTRMDEELEADHPGWMTGSPAPAEPVGLREAAQAMVDFDESEDKTHEDYQRVIQGLKAALATLTRTDEESITP